MVVPVWLRKAQFRLSRAKTSRNGFLLNPNDFRREAVRERIRADRSGLSLAILIIQLAPNRRKRHDFAVLSDILYRRLRITDTAGYLADGRISVLLPDTPRAGAWKVASDICDNYRVGNSRPDCEVWVYPDDCSASHHDREEHDDQALVNQSSQLDSLFAYPIPTVKRAVDVLGSSIGLALVAPLLLLFAAAIKVTSPGPVIYSQWREGHGGRRFHIYKFRTMRVDAHCEQSALREFSEQDGPAFKMSNDPRTTRIGRLLRRTSLDELPQLWNILMGDMSLVGPRPLPVEESLQCATWQRLRLAIVPGLTCVWQIRGRSVVSFESWMRMDLEYLRRRSFSYDLRLLLSTIPSLVFQRGPR